MDGVSLELSEVRKETFTPAEEHNSPPDTFGAGDGGAIMWYIGLNENLDVEDEKNERNDWEAYETDRDVLVALSKKDPVASPESQIGLAEDHVESSNISSGSRG